MAWLPHERAVDVVMRFTWSGNIDRLVRFGGWRYRFYGLTIGQCGIGLLRRTKEGASDGKG